MDKLKNVFNKPGLTLDDKELSAVLEKKKLTLEQRAQKAERDLSIVINENRILRNRAESLKIELEHEQRKFAGLSKLIGAKENSLLEIQESPVLLPLEDYCKKSGCLVYTRDKRRENCLYCEANLYNKFCNENKGGVKID